MLMFKLITNLLPTSRYLNANLENPGQQHSAIEELHLADNAITATGRGGQLTYEDLWEFLCFG